MTMNDQFNLWFVTFGAIAIYLLAGAFVIVSIAATIKHFTGVNIFKVMYAKFFSA